MPTQPLFTNPKQAIGFMRACLEQDDPRTLYAAFSQDTSSFWKERIFASLREIEATDTLESVFLDGGRITSFPDHESVLHLGGHGPRTHYLHIKLVKFDRGWVLESIHVCR
ncbi:MAG: hypothetical protein C3F13_10830 [Anaerolineales bacterium]|nr:hypothetical protein [Anaerolineae bacterium]PWB52796.1 MAG: hypothetical protein C3F13_10830 [Anaerolineales bacterium]